MTDLNKIRAAKVRAAEQAAIADLPPELLVGMEPKSPCAQPAPLDFKFIEFNPIRAMRGAEAARVKVIDATDPEGGGWLWMSRKDIKENMRWHGAHPELLKALAAYGGKA